MAPPPSLKQLYSFLTGANTSASATSSTNASASATSSTNASPTQPNPRPHKRGRSGAAGDGGAAGSGDGSAAGSTASEPLIVIDSSDDDDSDNDNSIVSEQDHAKQQKSNDKRSAGADDDTNTDLVDRKPKKRATLLAVSNAAMKMTPTTTTSTNVATAAPTCSDTDNTDTSRKQRLPDTARSKSMIQKKPPVSKQKVHKCVAYAYSPRSAASNSNSDTISSSSVQSNTQSSTPAGKQKSHTHPQRLSTASTATTALNTTWDGDEDNEGEDEPDETEHDTNNKNMSDDNDDDNYSDDAIFVWSGGRKDKCPPVVPQQPVTTQQRQQELFGTSTSSLEGGTCKDEHVDALQPLSQPQPVRSNSSSSSSPEKNRKDPPQSSTPPSEMEKQRPLTSWRRSTSTSTSTSVTTTSHKKKDAPVAAALATAANTHSATATTQEQKQECDTSAAAATTATTTATKSEAAATRLIRSCWKCAVDLAVESGEFCLYATHAHAVLNVPVCSVCADQVAAVDMNMNTNMNANIDSKNDDVNDDMDMDRSETCAGCAASTNDEDEDTLVLFCCDRELLVDNDNGDNDKNVCGRVFCKNCVVQAHGGGAIGRAHAQTLQDDLTGTWFCLACEPPAALQTLQLALEQGECMHHNDATTIGVTSPRSVDTILSELCLVETAKRECEEMSTTERDEERRLEFVKELSESLSGADLEEAVQDELTEWNEMCYKHDLRLGDTIASLQDELETVHNVDLAACYEKLGLQHRQSQSGTDDRPDWARSADRELDQRRSAPAPDPSHPSVYQASVPTQVEDLDAVDKKDDGDSVGDNGGQWRQLNWKISKDQIDEALEYEAAEFGLDGPPVVNEAQDARETLAEERESSTSSGNGRVRRDKYQMVRRIPSESKRCPTEKALSVARLARQEPGLTESPNIRPEEQRAHRNSRNLETQSPSSALKESTPSERSSVASAFSSGGSESDMFARSSLVLCSPSLKDVEKLIVRTVTVAKPFVKILKPHQIEGIKFIWENSFSDFAYCKYGDPTKVGGCILAHNMGLGAYLVPGNEEVSFPYKQRLILTVCVLSLSPHNRQITHLYCAFTRRAKHTFYGLREISTPASEVRYSCRSCQYRR